MSIQLITEFSKREEWNKAVNHPLQTWEWGDIKKDAGNEILRIGLLENNCLIAGYLITLHRIPYTRYVVGNCARSMWPRNDVIQFAAQELKKRNALFLKLEPDCSKEEAGLYKLPIFLSSWKENNLSYKKSQSHIFASHTFIMDLHFSEEQLLSRMHTKTRYNIRLAEKKGVTIRDMTNIKEGFDVFFSLYRETIRRQKYLGHSYQYHKKVWEIMKNKYAKILVAYFNNEPLAAYELFFFKNRGYYVYGGSSDKNKEMMASNLLMWEALRLSKKNGCTYFDMWGALSKEYSRNDPWAGFHRFKEGYGGMHKTYLPTIDIVINPIGYSLFSFIWPIRNKYEELRQVLQLI